MLLLYCIIIVQRLYCGSMVLVENTEPASYTGSYTTVSKEIANTEIAMSQSADRVTIDNINIVSETSITIEKQMLWLTDKQMHFILLQGQDI
jgi:hypothetical protein